MKIIGAEIRFGVTGHRQTEAKVVPLNIEVPEVIRKQSFRPIECSVTIHTSHGDETVNFQFRQHPTDPYHQVSEETLRAALDEFAKAIEAGS